MAKKIICDSCGGEFDGGLTKCPYCGTLNPGGAEKAYLERLDDVHEELEDLKGVPEEEVRQAVKRSGSYLKKVIVAVVLLTAVVLGGFYIWERAYYAEAPNSKSDRENYFWAEENFPIMDQMYAQGEYDELVRSLSAAEEEGYSTYRWEHYEFCNLYQRIMYAQDTIRRAAEGQKLTQNSCSLLLHDEWWVQGMEDSERFTEEEKEILRPLAKPVLEDFETRWNFTEEEYQAMTQELAEIKGYVSFDTIDAFLKKWYKEYEKK